MDTEYILFGDDKYRSQIIDLLYMTIHKYRSQIIDMLYMTIHTAYGMLFALGQLL